MSERLDDEIEPLSVADDEVTGEAVLVTTEGVPVGGGGSTTLVEKVAVTSGLDVSVREHEPVPVHAPDHPEKVEPERGVAVRVTMVPDESVVWQREPHEIPPPDTVPCPVPCLETARVNED